MFVKLVVLACTLAVGLAGWHGPLAGGLPAAQYPAGVSPHACPNYPHCSNPAVAAAGAGGWGGAGAWNGGWNGDNGQWHGDNGQWNGDNGQWNGDNGQWNQGWNQNGLDNGEYTGDGDYRGEGLAESGAYGVHDNSGAWNNGGWDNGAWNGAGNYAGAYGHHGAAQVPAGVDPHSCPNYPFCH